MLIKGMMKPMKEIPETEETIQELDEREEFALDEEQKIDAGEEDLRPEQGERYQKIRAIAPKNPVVPMSAPGAYKIS
jgi:hypothetical protein